MMINELFFIIDNIIHLRKRVNTGGQAGASPMNNFDGTGASNRLAIPGRSSSTPLSNPAINRQLQYMPPPPLGMNQFGQPAGDNQENSAPRNVSPGSVDYNATAWQQGRSPSPTKGENMFPGTTTTSLRRNSNFAGPTFSELMRRSAPVYKDFAGSLRDQKAFYVSTPTVITNANQDPQFAVVRRASIAMHAAKMAAQTSDDPELAGSPTSTYPAAGMAAYAASFAEENIANNASQHKPFAW